MPSRELEEAIRLLEEAEDALLGVLESEPHLVRRAEVMDAVRSLKIALGAAHRAYCSLQVPALQKVRVRRGG